MLKKRFSTSANNIFHTVTCDYNNIYVTCDYYYFYIPNNHFLDLLKRNHNYSLYFNVHVLKLERSFCIFALASPRSTVSSSYY